MLLKCFRNVAGMLQKCQNDNLNKCVLQKCKISLISHNSNCYVKLYFLPLLGGRGQVQLLRLEFLGE
jgi:hypothetical protein